jgi:glycine cleavage system H protein
MARVQDHDFPEHLLYDIENQVWYELLADGTVRAGFTTWAAALMGEILVFTPKRVGKDFEKNKWFAMVEGGKWVGAARAAFDGTIVSQNEALVDKPGLLMSDPFGKGWMLVVRPAVETWRDGLCTGPGLGAAIENWIVGGSYKDRAG